MLATFSALEAFPAQLEQLFEDFPGNYRHWAPASWDGIPSESFTAIEQLCHVRDIEIDGYHVRLRRMIEEENPILLSIDGYELAEQRRYQTANPAEVLASIRTARGQTMQIIRSLTKTQFYRTGFFPDYGQLTVKALIHYLCSHDQQHLAGMQWLLGKIECDSSL